MFKGILMIALMLLFIGICVWAWNPRNRSKFDEASQLPLKSDDNLNERRGGNGE